MAILLLLAGCVSEDAATLRYRLTLEIETPFGVRSGSSVVESTITKGPGFGDASGISYHLHGEATAVELPNGRVLFGLLRSNSNSDTAGYHASLVQDAACQASGLKPLPDPSLCAGGSWREFRSWAKKVGLSTTLMPKDFPLLVTLGNNRDAVSVSAVPPGNLKAAFGLGYRLRAIAVTVTDEPLTNRLESHLPWRGSITEGMLNGDRYEDFRKHSLAAHLSYFDFSTTRID